MELEIQKDAWPVRGRFVIARGARTEAHTLTAVLRAGETLGRGECTPYARYGETLESVEAAIRNAFAQLGPFDGARARLQSLLPPGAARNALDCALWDLEAKRTGTPVHILAGLERSEPAVTAFTLSVDTPEAMAEAVSTTGLVPEVVHWFVAELQKVDAVDDDATTGASGVAVARKEE